MPPSTTPPRRTVASSEPESGRLLDPADLARLRTAYDPESFRQEGHALVDQLADYLAVATKAAGARGGLPALPVLPWREPAAALAAWSGAASAEPAGDLGTLVGRVLAESTHLHHPGFVGHQVAPPLPRGALLELVSAFVNNGMAIYEMGPAATAIERHTITFLAGLLGFATDGEEGADGVLTSGGSLGNLTALLAARAAVTGVDVWRDGAQSGPGERLAVLVAKDTHYSIDRAIRILGLGAGGAIPVAVDDQHRMRPDALAHAIKGAVAAGRRPFAVVASAGSTATGAYDPLPAIADVCAVHGLWLHVDGAHGASAALSRRYRDRVLGIERADSVVWDAHKLMMMPATVTAVIFKHGRRGAAAFAQQAAYIFPPQGTEAGGVDTRAASNGVHADVDAGADTDADGRDPGGTSVGGTGAGGNWWDIGMRTLECTKRMMGLELLGGLRLGGTALFAAYVDRTFDLARALATRVQHAGDFDLLIEPACNIVCFRHRPPALAGAAPAVVDAHQSAVRRAVIRRGNFYLVETRLPEGQFLRTTLMNALTTEADLDGLLDEIRAAAASC